jgi:hypothetical protein
VAVVLAALLSVVVSVVSVDYMWSFAAVVVLS